MKTLQHILATILLAMALVIPIYAGDMGGPSSVTSPTPLPTDTPAAVTTALPPKVSDDTDSPALTVLALDFLVSALSIY